MIVGLSSLGMITLNEFILGGLVLPSHEYTWEMEANTGTNLPFFKRLSNFVTMWSFLYNVNFNIFFFQQKLAEKYLGPLPPLTDIMKNTSLIFINEIDILSPARPKLPNMISFNFFHVSDNPTPLSKVRNTLFYKYHLLYIISFHTCREINIAKQNDIYINNGRSEYERDDKIRNYVKYILWRKICIDF